MAVAAIEARLRTLGRKSCFSMLKLLSEKPCHFTYILEGTDISNNSLQNNLSECIEKGWIEKKHRREEIQGFDRPCNYRDYVLTSEGWELVHLFEELWGGFDE